MATGEKSEAPHKENKVTHSEEEEKKPSKDIQDKGSEAKEVENAAEIGEPKKNEAVFEDVILEEEKKKNEGETKVIVVADKKKEAEIENKNNEVEKGSISESAEVEKSSAMEKVVPHSDEQEKNLSKDVQDRGIETKDGKNAGEAGEPKKDEGVIGKMLVEEKKETDADTRDVVAEDKRKEGEAEEAVLEEKKNNDQVERGDASSESTIIEKNSSFREKSNFLYDLKEHEKRALVELRSKVENAILGNKLFKGNKNRVVGNEKEKILEKEGGENGRKGEENGVKEAVKEKETSKKVEEIEEKEKTLEKEGGEKEKTNEGKGEENFVKEIEKEKESSKKVEEIEVAKALVEEKLVVKEEKEEDSKENKPSKQEDEEKDKKAEEGQKEKNNVATNQERKVDVIDEDIAIWRVPLLPSKGDSATDVILLKFLTARDFEVNDAFEMLRNTLQWRKDNNVDSILDEDFGDDLGSIEHMDGASREGHPVCYSNFKLLGNEEVYNKMLGNEESREMFIRRRVQLMEKAIQKLDFKPGGVSSILLVHDLKDMPGPSKKELRLATKQVVGLLQDNYPEFVARNIFINVPFWYYAYSASTLLLPFLTPRTNSKFVFARPSRVTDNLLKFIAAEELPVHYGGLKRENDPEFSTEDAASEIVVNQSSSESIQLPVPEVGTTLIWEVIVLGWEVNYKEEFFPTDEGSYGIIVQKDRRIGGQQGSLRNSFTNKEPGNVVFTVENGSLIKKKRVCYRYKIKNTSSS
ncbi:hypothetical protein PRUPE_4G134100 [Prunus persica]|uniref:CRAL-TRIO domain-containing protein n=1 Tax=Prunus persica TaxID=3760 RepID=A0A251PK20_PRUPE|nr:hypothetical protein PRUPE_4G134100 [Prunus persica]